MKMQPDHPVPSRLHFARITASFQTHNLSLTVHGSPFWEAHLLFRDILRSDPGAAVDFAALKRWLAKVYPQDPLAYAAGKDSFIAGVLQGTRK